MPRSTGAERFASALALFAVLVLLPAALRALLAWESRADLAGTDAGQLARAFLVGMRLDAVLAAVITAPLAGCLLLPAGPGRRLLCAWCALALGLAVPALCAELGFFRYYGFRANYLVLEHASDPEVRRTLARAYFTPGWSLFVIGTLASAAALHRASSAGLTRWLPPLERPGIAALPLLAACLLVARGTLDHRPLNPAVAVIGSHRRVNEIAASGTFNVLYELEQGLAGTRIALSDVQPTLPPAEAHARARHLLGAPEGRDAEGVNPFARQVWAPLPAGRPLSVVVVVMESFTSRLVGALGGEPALSPEFDALAREGLLLTHCYATGERTIQGLEAVLASFPPLPGVSAVRRPESQTGFTTLATLLGERGYDTLFLYGGQGIFDHMRSFFLGNGFGSFIEEDDFTEPRFRGSWGVSDEDLFRRANREFQERWERGRPFLGAILTVSLHSPWEFPAGRAPGLPAGTRVPAGFEREELGNFLYADYALGEFMREARRLPYSADTLFVFVGDHGVHLRGRELLPAEEYRVPALFLAEGRLAPGRLAGVTSQLDLAPTILGLVGGEFTSPFFGANVRARSGEDGLAILVYGKRHYAARRADRLTVLTSGGGLATYRVGAAASTPSPPAPAHEEDARDALALLQVAEELLESRRYNSASLAARE